MIKLVRKPVPATPIVITYHAADRIQERMSSGFVLPEAGSFVRLLTVMDTKKKKPLLVLRVRGGVILGRWGADGIIVVTVLTENHFHRLQLKSHSRFIPMTTDCYEISSVLMPN